MEESTLNSGQDEIRDPPRRFGHVVRNIGPGIVVTGCVIGAGELLITTSIGAQYGFVFLWGVIVCALIKYFIQVELGRFCIVHNATSIDLFNRLPGPKWRGTSWFVLLFFVARLMVTPAHLGILGSVAGLMAAVVPGMGDVRLWGAILVIVLLVSLHRGYYGDVETLVTVLVVGFSLGVVAALFLVQRSEFAISAINIGSGLTFRIPKGGWVVAVALMGGVGVNAWELFMYPYWIIEKGYPRFVGPREQGNPDAWAERCNGWMRVLRTDALICTIGATAITVAYFLMGAAVLHRIGVVPKGLDVVMDISALFTETYGEWALALFVAGAFCTLFSTLYVVTAAYGRVWTDLLKSLRLITINTERERLRWYRVFQTCFPLAWLVFLLGVQRPLQLLVIGLFVNGLMLPIVAVNTSYLARKVPTSVRMSRPMAFMLTLTTVVIVIYTLANIVGRVLD